jgi:hypothetical protein
MLKMTTSRTGINVGKVTQMMINDCQLTQSQKKLIEYESKNGLIITKNLNMRKVSKDGAKKSQQ